MAKGGEFERKIAKYLTIWLSGKEKPYIYWRMPGSGSLATISEANKELSGDIHALRLEGAFFTDRFSVEVKNGYPKANFHQHLKNIKNFEIKDFWLQCLEAAQKAGKHGMLVWKKKGLKEIVGISPNTASLKEIVGISPNTARLLQPKLKNIVLVFDDGTTPIRFYDMIDFFVGITPDRIRGIPCLS